MAPLLILAAALASALPARAQGSLSRVYPNGAQRGTKVTLTFAGTGLPDPATLVVEGEGIRPLGPFVKGKGEVEIAPDAAPGVRRLRLVGPKAATSPRPFSIGTLPEMEEKEPNNLPEQAQRLDQLPVTVNGGLPTRPDIDQFRVSLKKGECLVVAGESRVLGAPTNLLVRIRDAARTELLVQMDYRTRDPLLGFTAPADGDYWVELQEVMNNYSNLTEDYVYRVTLTKGPWIDYASPSGVQRGTTARLRFTGWNLGGQPGPGSVETEVVVPADAGPTLDVTGGGAPNRVPVLVGSVPHVTEQEPNGPDAAQALTLPVAVSGAFQERGDRDRFLFAARGGEPLLLQVDAREQDSLADPMLLLYDAAGKQLLRLDDSDRRARDPRTYWTPPADGAYTVVLRDIAAGSRSGPGYFYRLTIAPPEPELRLTTPNPTLVLKPGEKLEVAVTVSQEYQPDELEVLVEGLPAGVTAAPVTVSASPKKAASGQVKIALVAIRETAPTHALLRIVARPKGGSGPPVAATASWDLSSDRSGVLARGTTDRLLLLIPAP